ncbi:MAG: hypothetical protein JJT81_18970, partial [Rubellimicrobium sp.]|nr:hypothetical protein [Rubellimicrobium sp.]
MIRKFLCISALAAGGASGAAAITLETVTWRGHSVWQATGPIERGDVEHFRSALANTPSLPHGLPVVLLDSPGGDVKEALAIAGLLEQYPAHMVIPEGAECASACASIIFIAGELRTVEPGGLLGQHSCSSDGEPNDFCNEAIARHALARGVPYGSVEAFTKYVPPSEILWFRRRDADCWGLSRYPFTSESGYVTTADCALEMITGVMPPAQVAWRVDFMEDGYRAFLR